MAHKQVCEYLEQSIRVGFQRVLFTDGLILICLEQEDFHSILAERQLVEKLNELDKLVEEAKRSNNAAELKRSGAG